MSETTRVDLNTPVDVGVDADLHTDTKSRKLSSMLSHLPTAIGPAVSLVSGIYIYLVGMLGLWVLLVATAAGWSPVVITSGSMSPSLGVGDVIMIEDHPDELVGQRSIVTFQRGDQVITHRIFEVQVGDELYITKGDANPTPDTDAVPADSVIGVGRLVVPLLGLPVVWLQSNQLGPLAAMVILSLAAVGLTLRQARVGRGGFRAMLTDQSSVVADQAVRRVRILIAVMIGSQFVIDGSRFTIDGINITSERLLVISLVWLTATNLFSLRFPIESYGWVVAVAQLVADTVLVLFMTTATGGTGIGWVLTAVPIVEAAVRFRLAGALVHWMLMAVLAILGRLWILNRISDTAANTIDELERLLDQMSVLLLVIVPGAFLAEQLLGDVLLQRRATLDAEDRGRLLENVAEVGHEVTKIGSALFETLTASALDLGFDSVDVWARPTTGIWSQLGTASHETRLVPPAPGSAGSGLRPIDLAYNEVLVDFADPEPTERTALETAGVGFVVRITIDAGDTLVALRGVGGPERRLEPSAVEALRLLCGQATVAMHNKGLVGELQELHNQMEHQALHDALTGLPNRAFFLRELEAQLAATSLGSLPPGRTTSVLFLDLNGFKPVNDRLGHDAGDHLLQVVAERLLAAVGSDGRVARLGGDEFTVLLPDSDNDLATQIAGRIHDALGNPIRLQQDSVQVGASIGVAHYQPDIDADELLRRSDTAMYHAKGEASGRRLSFYHADLEMADALQRALVQDLQEALANDGLTLVFQPLVSVVERQVAGAEVLLRWEHPERGTIDPNVTLATAEQGELVGELNRWILTKSLKEVTRFPLDGQPFTLAVNASPAELASQQLIPNIRHALSVTGVDPKHLVIELSERIVASGSDLGLVAEELIEMGVGLSLDDFGQGKTSLGHLRHLPIRQLKLDSLLVQQACTSNTDRVILNSVVTLGHDLGFEVVAEGVETDAHMAAVIDAGADLVQGFGLYRPILARDLSQLLQSRVDQRRAEAAVRHHRRTDAGIPYSRRSTDIADLADWPTIGNDLDEASATFSQPASNKEVELVQEAAWPDR